MAIVPLQAAQNANVYARNALSKLGTTNIRPAFASTQEREAWELRNSVLKPMKEQIMGPSIKVRGEKRPKPVDSEWSMNDVVSYGKAAAKAGLGNCWELSAVACARLSGLKVAGDYYACILRPADHIFVVIGEDPDGGGEFEMDFGRWGVDAAVCDPWADIACLARNYVAEWKQRMREWAMAGITVPLPQKTELGFFTSSWVAPTDAAWMDAPEASRKLNKAGPGAGATGGGCCYITTACCASLGLPDDCNELRTLRRFRDEVLLTTPAGRRDVLTYYELAPAIVAAIDRLPEARRHYADIYAAHVLPAVQAVRAGRHERAHRLFADLVESTRRRFLA